MDFKMKRNWSKEELDFIKQNTGTIPLKDIARKLGRSISSIHHKSSKLKLKVIPKRIEDKCKNCGNVIFKTPFQKEKGRKSFCNKSCMFEYSSKNLVTVSCEVCGKEFQESRSRIKTGRGKYCGVICRNNKRRSHYRRKLDEPAVIRDYALNKKSATAIAKEYGCNHKRILEILAKNKVKIRTSGDYLKGVKYLDKRKNLPISRIMAGYESGLSTYDLAEKYRCSQSTIKKRLVENGIKIRQGAEIIEAFKKSDKYPEHINKMKDRLKIQMSKPEWREFHRRKALDMYAKGKFKQSNTLPERIIKAELLKRGYKEGIDFFHQYKFGNKFSIDFAFPKQKLLIEVQGDYWHSNLGNKDFMRLNKIQAKNFNRDVAKRLYIAKYDNSSWRLIELWESDIKKKASSCVDEIENALKS